MTDRRSLFATPRVAHVSLRGRIDAPAYAEATWQRVSQAAADLCATRGGARDRQVLWGQQLEVLERQDGWSFVRVARDGYVGWIDNVALAGSIQPTHRIAVPASHLYPAPDLKRHESHWLSFGSELRVVSTSGVFCETAEGLFAPTPHLRPLTLPFSDWVAVAQLHLGAPYLWGGNSMAGIDCSGLVQAALLAAGHPCPADTDQQRTALGADLPPDAPADRGDLYFWQGHVAIAVDAQTLIHANAHAMAVSYEPVEAALARIAATGSALLCRKRLT